MAKKVTQILNSFLQPLSLASAAGGPDEQCDSRDAGDGAEAGVSGEASAPRGQYLLLSHASSEAGTGAKKRLARQRMVNGSIDHGLISDSHAQRKLMFLKQHKVASR